MECNESEKFICEAKQIVSLSPSEYMRQFLMTTEERLELLSRDYRPSWTEKKSSNNLKDFEVVPSLFIFQRFTSGNIYNATLTIRNTGKILRCLKLVSEPDPNFIVQYKDAVPLSNIRLAPRMENSYNVRFSPDENRDYEYEIKFETDRDVLSIPITAIGPRPILDFPDTITIPETAVKISSSKSILVRNLGDCPAIFSLFTSSPHFSLEPTKGIIEEEETVQFVVNFLSNTAGFFEDHFFLRYESGEVVGIKVRGSAINCNVRLERGSVRMQDEVYIGLSTSKSLRIFNRSEFIVNYRWMRNKDQETDRVEKHKYEKICESLKNLEIIRSADLVHYNICLPEAHELVCQRIYNDDVASLVNENFLYNDGHFSLIPMEGEIWPRSSIDVTIIFKPDEIGELSSTAYLEVTGREERIPLGMSGVSIGPLLKLNVSSIDVSNIFLCSVHNYEIVCANKGLIPGTLVYRARTPNDGGTINVTPEELKLKPGQHKSFNLSFSSTKNGSFVEPIEFVVKESLQVIKIYISGNVVCPTLRFDKAQLDFGTTALGFVSTQEVTLHNDSLVPVTFSIIVPDDGTETAITQEDFAKFLIKPSFPCSPREFIIIPHEGIVAARSSLKVTINLNANVVRVGKTTLRVDMWDSDSVPVSLPIIFQSIVASMTVKPAEIAIRFCFMNFPYSRNFVVENTSEVEGYFYLVPQTITESTTMLYSMSTNQGYLAPGQSKNISLTIITRAMGKQKCVVSMLSFGDKGASACCILSCNGQGPVVSINPTTLDFNNVDLLQEKKMSLTLISDSPVPAEFKASLSNKHSPWTIFPTSGELDPDRSIDLEVTVFLRDVGKHTDKIIVTITNSRTVIVTLNANGVGSCIVCDPQIFPKFDMGLLFSNQDTSLGIVLTNHGSRNLKLIFSNSMEIKTHGGQIQPPTCNKFSIDPFVLELPARDSKQVFCHSRSDTCGIISEQWWLHCYMEGQGKREIIGESMFTASFVEPSISFSKRKLTFRKDVQKDRSESTSTIDELYVTNESGLSLKTRLSIDPPFGIITDDEDRVQELKIIIADNAKRRIRIFFVPRDEGDEKRYSQIFNGILKLEYDEHPNADNIKCVGTVNFPNIAPLPREIIFSCPLGCSTVENIYLTNEGPLDVYYRFEWIEESISITREPSNIKKKTTDKTIENTNVEDEFDREDLFDKIKDVLLSILGDNSFAEDKEITVLENLRVDGPIDDDVNRICSIVPSEAVVPAYSSQCVAFGFHATEILSLKGTVLCEIEGGPSEFIAVSGTTDVVKYDLEKNLIDFGQQMVLEGTRRTIKLTNLSTIELVYHIELTTNDEFLTIRPMTATVPGRSTIELEFYWKPVVPEVFKVPLLLRVDHHPPMSILVEGVAVIPQVYVELPRKNIFETLPVELGYRAVQQLDTSSDHPWVTEDGWEMVVHDNTLPTTVDIEMAIERSIARELFDEARLFGETKNIGAHKGSYALPGLFSPDYILDMGYVIAGETSTASTRVYNYGDRGVRVCLKKPDRMESLAKHGISIHLDSQGPLIPGKSLELRIAFTPVQSKESEKSMEVNRRFYLEVSNGFMVPIIISAIVTSSFVTVHPKVLEFPEVLIGECALMPLLIKNDGLIDCSWEARLPPARRNQSGGPFSLRDGADLYSPGQSGSVKVYFRPRKSGNAESQLVISMHRGVEPSVILLRGRGIENKVQIIKPFINFQPVVPYTTSEERVFTVQNIGQRPVELFWHHLDSLILLENRLIRVLTHYYQVDEILLPVRQPGEAWPRGLYDFYDFLVEEMALSLATHHRTSSISMLEQDFVESKINLSTTVSTELDTLETEGHVPRDNPDEIETLLHRYIEKLQKLPDFRENMKDPVKEVFDAREKREEPLEQTESSLSARKTKVCVVFHGAPSTEYQATACETARLLALPVLNVNTAITEMIALGDTTSSAKLRETIDSKYRQLLAIREKSDVESGILTIDEMNNLDTLSRYQYEIEIIENCLDNTTEPGTLRDTARSHKDDGKTSHSHRIDKAEHTFLDVDVRLLIEVLEQRLLMPDLRNGFVLQTLKDSFIKSETKILTSLLQILGDIEYPIFVTFHKVPVLKETLDVAEDISKSRSDENLMKLMEIDAMSPSEYDMVSDTDKEVYREKILRVRRKEALDRRLLYQQRISEFRKQKVSKRRGVTRRPSDIRSKSLTKPKTLKSGRSPDKSVTSESSGKRKIEKTESLQTSARKTAPKETLAIHDVIDPHASNLESILSIIRNWNPTQKTIVPPLKETDRSKISKYVKSKDRSRSDVENLKNETSDKFWIWHVKTTNSSSSLISDIIVDELARNKEIFNPTGKEILPEMVVDLRSEIYSVARPKKLTIPRKILNEEKIFDLVVLRSSDSISSSESFDIDEQDCIKPKEYSLEPRFVLEPNESRTFRIYFGPTRPDFFQKEFSLGFVNSNDSSYTVKCTGTSCVPRIDMNPSRIFNKLKASKKNEMNDPTFFEDSQTFDFGSILLTGRDNKVHRKNTSFKLWNDSKIDLELNVSLMSGDTKSFDIEPRQIIIKPDEFGLINVTAGATRLGSNEDRLVLLVKDNPHVEVIKLRSNGEKLEVELDGKNISFGRVLLRREMSKSLKIRNKSTVPIFWRISPVDSIDSQLKLIVSTGWTKARDESDVTFTYLSTQIGVMEKVSLNVNVFLNDKDRKEDSLFKDIITITGETYDVAVDVDSANPINLGIVRVGSMASGSFDIKNRGQYEVKFVIELQKIDKTVIDRDLGKNVMEDLEISPATGTLVPGKITTINVVFRPKFEMNLRGIPLLRCDLIDTNNDATIVAEFPLTLTITSHYARFRLIPESELSFGPMGVCDKKSLHLNVENTGVFPIAYRVTNPLASGTSPENSSSHRKKNKSPGADLKKKGTSKAQEISTNLRIGPFSLSKMEGSVEPGDVKSLSVDCYPETEGSLEETILVHVDNCLPENRSGRTIILKVDSYLPRINFNDLDAIFPESYVVDDIWNFTRPDEIDAHTIFSRNEKCLYFADVTIHKTYTTSIKLHNRSLVPGKVTVSLRPDVLTPKNASPDTFALDTVQEYVAPMSSRIFSVSFTPSLIETYTGVLEASVELPKNLKTDTHELSVKLSGEGCVPEISLIEPPIERPSGRSIVRFGRCLVGERNTRNLTIRNIGKISAQLIIGVFNDTDDLYKIRMCGDCANSRGSLQYTSENDSCGCEQRSVIYTSRPGEVVTLQVEFRAKEIGRKEAEIRFHILDNPYENVTVELEAEGFVESVVFENLPHVETSRSSVEGIDRTRKSIKHRSGVPISRAGSVATISSQSLSTPSLTYKLDYGTCFVDKMSKINFKIVNKSDDRYFRFELSSHPNVVFVPSVGHLPHCGGKDITANFFTAEPTIHKETILQCAINEIAFSSDDDGTNFWDDRQTRVEWMEIDDVEDEESFNEIPTKRMVVPAREPSHEIVAGTSRIIHLIFSVTAAYTEYSCIVQEINFKDTLMFQDREYKFDIENSGNVDLVFNWKIEMEAGYPTRWPENVLRSKLSTTRSTRSADSRPSSRSSGGILYPESEKRIYRSSSRYQRGDELSHSCRPLGSQDKFSLIDVEPYECSCLPISDLFSDSFGGTHRSTESWIDDSDDQPFTVKPEVGLISPGKSLTFTLRFSPLDVFDYRASLTCQIENLSPSLEQPKILATGRSLLPYCHFDIEESDYLTSGRRDSRLDFPTTEDVVDLRVVEFRVVGIGESHEKEFYLINPTTDNYRFKWEDLTPRECHELPFFHCLRDEDLAESGKRTKVSFSFFAEDVGTFESFWRFSIEKYKLETIFLVVATVEEPSIHFDKARLRMKATILRDKVEDSLVIANDESLEYSWKILSKTLHSEEGAFQNLTVEPMSGILSSKSQQILKISLVPSRVGEFTFPLQCQVKGMKNPLSILVSAVVSQIIPRISYDTNMKQEIFEARYDRDNILDFGKLTLNKPAIMTFRIENIGEIMFHYTWNLGISDTNYYLTISTQDEHVPSSSETTCCLSLTALRKTIIRQHLVTLTIDKGPVYRMFIKASAKHSSVEFSFTNYDFGPCYIRDQSSPAHSTRLLITNNEKAPAIVECAIENLPHITIDHEALSQAIPGNSTTAVSISFRPTETLRYNENIIFNINGSTVQQIVKIKGEGIPYKICLENPCDKFIELGSVPVGKTVARKIRVQNAARAPVELLFDLMQNLPGYNDHRRRQNVCPDTIKNSSKLDESAERKVSIVPEILNIEPRDKISLLAGKSVEIVVKFEPVKRISNFVEKIGALADTTIFPLFIVRGSSLARDFRLDRSHIYFGTVVEGCTSFTKLVLHNSGDFGAKFKWKFTESNSHFDVKPTAGYCSPGMSVTFNVTFHPNRRSAIIEAEATIDIEKHPSLKLKCSGACCKIPEPIDTLKFSIPVRSTQTKNVTITNDSNTVWNVETTHSGEYFHAEETFIVPAKKSHSCTVTYSPLVMNNEKTLHEGRLLIKLPEGNPPLVYKLVGSSLTPEVAGKIVRQLPAKTKYAELLPVHNWLNKTQSFYCNISLVNDPKTSPVEYSFTGNSRLDVPGYGTRDYHASFYGYKESTLNFRIQFTNDDDEYEFYEVQYKVTKPDVQGTIKLASPARSSTCHRLEINNPLENRSVTFVAHCQHRDIVIHNIPKIVPAKTSDEIVVEYSPLLPGESVAKLDVSCPELGTFPYELKLKATSAPLEKVIRVTATLGSSTKFPIDLNNVSKKTAEYTITVDDPSFACDRTISIGPQKRKILEIIYEPRDAINVKAMLRCTSQSLGEICFPLIGSYTLPKPQGPFTILRNNSMTLTFKNVFGVTTTFAYVLDGSDGFSFTASSNVLKSKETARIIVKFGDGPVTSDLGGKYVSPGKLVISCMEPSPVDWVFYLRGIEE